MMTLRTSLGSPFGRKARIAIICLGLENRVRVVPAQTMDANDPIHAINPLRKVPVLVRDDNIAVYDSPVILEYLDWIAGGGRILPSEPEARFAALTTQALGDGLTESLVLVRYEDRWRSAAQRCEPWLAHQQKKIDGALTALDQTPPPGEGVNVGQIAVACGLGYYERMLGPAWRAPYPRLNDWFDEFAARIPGFAQTES
jgi:glutathione S-transferase